jgi:hypothetical protein
VRQDVLGTQWTWNGSTRVSATKREDFPSFSNFGIANTNDVFPVAGLHLQATPVGNQVRLDWSTDLEVNTAHFEVERSLDGESFVPIGQVAAGGNLPDGARYNSMDTRPQFGVNYYRLRQVDLNGDFAYSNTVLATFGAALGLQLYPNPAQDAVTVTYAGADPVSLTLSNMLGQQIASFEITGSQMLQLGHLPKGIYLVTARAANGDAFTQKLVLE